MINRAVIGGIQISTDLEKGSESEAAHASDVCAQVAQDADQVPWYHLMLF